MDVVTLVRAWLSMNQEMKEYYAERVVEICQELAKFEVGIDGKILCETFLIRLGRSHDHSRETLLKNCKELRTGSLKFYHCDMGPSNIKNDVEKKELAINDWERAGFVPVGWIRTKFLEGREEMYLDCVMATNGDRMAWGKVVGNKLG